MDNINEDLRKNWNRIDIVAALHKSGVTMRELSVQAGLKPDSLKNALARPYPRGERIIASALKLKPEDIWPERYSNQRKKTASSKEGIYLPFDEIHPE
ncbi:helix-turn-helix domain-containing protein [Citrobacter sp. JGM124]|uniref:helix-turn-helix domain-containing protein n=1 Tax=Citrobacter sp. JGM124 TaxID=2799789 RepID=UPI001BA5BDB2|nr:helix-turn-helix domain-containing protein [Citrobacter sp. JGM124]MBS0849672.1 helix-turn-helix domain-containing protein [Citrobacter sp. JGM124]